MSLRTRLRSAALLLALLVSAVPARSAPAGHVIHVSIDGLHAGYLQEEIAAGHLPTLARLQREGAWTANARTDVTYTVTLPNHTCMLTGRPVERPRGMPSTVHHGYTDNVMPAPGVTLHDGGNPQLDYVASTFDAVHDAGGSTALYASKEKFVLFERSYDEAHGAPHPNGRAKIDRSFIHVDGGAAPSATMNRRLVEDLATLRPQYVFVHYGDADVGGHDTGWGSEAWRRAIARVDAQLGEVLRTIEGDAELRGHTAIVVTADHGGVGDHHGDAKHRENYTIPVIVWGAGVDPGDLYAFNRGTRADPGRAHPGYDAPRPPIRNGDTGNLALSLLGLGPVPGSLVNAEQDLRFSAPR